MADDDGRGEHVTFEVTSTVADCAAFQLYISRRPRRVALQLAIFVALGVAFFILQVLLDVLGALLTSSHGMGAALRTYFTGQIHRNLGETAPWVCAVVAALFAVNLLVLVPRQCRLIARRIVNSYPEIGGAEANARLVGSMRLDARGAESMTPNERLFLAWPLFDRLVETKRYLFLVTGASSAIVLPKRTIDAAHIERVRDLCHRFLSPAQGRP